MNSCKFWLKSSMEIIRRMYNNSHMLTVMTRLGPPCTISGGIWGNGQFSIDMISSLEQRASSNGSVCRFLLSLMYKDSKRSRVPISSGKKFNRFSPTDKYDNWDNCLYLQNKNGILNISLYNFSKFSSNRNKHTLSDVEAELVYLTEE